MVRDENFKEALAEAVKSLKPLSDITGYYNNYVSIPVPSLCIEYILQYSGFPLGCFVCIIGRKASFKSQLSLEIARWTLPFSGHVVLLDTEGGVNPLAFVVLGEDNLSAETCVYLEDWQAKLTKYADFFKRYNDNGVSIPVTFIVDSIVGAESKNVADKIQSDGFIAAAYPVEAKLISAYLKHKNTMLSSYPFLIIGVNHVKDVINPMAYRPEEYVPGGAALLYHAQLVLKVKKTKKPEFRGDGYEAAVSITVEKNRLGPEELVVEVPIYFRQIEVNGECIIRPEWDWHQATVDLLCDGSCVSPRYREKFLKRLSEVINVGKKSAGRYGTRYYCSELGISDKDAVDASTLVEELYKNQDLLKAVRNVLMIKPSVMFRSDVPFKTLVTSKPSFYVQEESKDAQGENV